MLARYGGEEFVVVMPSATTEQAFTVAERLRVRVGDKPIGIPGSAEPLTITISVGVATTSDPMEIADSLLDRADTALYEAKSKGRNRVCIEQSGKNRYRAGCDNIIDRTHVLCVDTGRSSETAKAHRG
eukprot:TRINITY_DN12111_c0_g1_i1.p1 TRINITY_DN12111_c0_g1~~TRINITY_DN12111_c0_g1_i1.p1  ORF type:complete len:128 (+),score=45.09 TRINITY_DN12111_c0_g1_i1:126-509(+)